MGRQPCCDKVGLKKGPWTAEEDRKLIKFIHTNGHCCWRAVPKLAGLLRCGKSCRLRWTNYLRPDLKRGLLSEFEEKLVIELHSLIGNRWSKIASHLPGRTDNEIKNLWNTHIKKKLKKMGIDPITHKPIPSTDEHNHQKEQQQQQELGLVAGEDGRSENIILQCPQRREEKSITSSFDSIETETFLQKSPGFCTDEVPMIQPHEIVLPCASTTSYSSTSMPSSCYSSGSSAKAEEIQFPCMGMEWPEPMYLSGMDDFSQWDLISCDVDGTLALDPLNQYQEIAFDLESRS